MDHLTSGSDYKLGAKISWESRTKYGSVHPYSKFIADFKSGQAIYLVIQLCRSIIDLQICTRTAWLRFESKLGKSNASCFELSRQKQVKWVTPKEGVVIQYNYMTKTTKTFILLTAF